MKPMSDEEMAAWDRITSMVLTGFWEKTDPSAITDIDDYAKGAVSVSAIIADTYIDQRRMRTEAR